MTRQDYINAIAALLDKADYRKLRLVWITLLELLDDPKAVRGILLHASRLYCEQERRKPQEDQQ